MARKHRLDLDRFHYFEYFKETQEIGTRNQAILLAIEDGYTQGEIARYLGLSMAMVSKIFRGVKWWVKTQNLILI